MSKYTKLDVKVPDINRTYVSGAYSYSKPETITANKAMMNTIYRDYGKFINKWGIEFELDDSILVGFIATESGGVNAPPNRFEATGLMQMTPLTVYEIISKWQKIVGSPLSKTALAFFTKALPSIKKIDANTEITSAIKSEISSALRNNIEFNIAIGTANIRWLLEALKTDDKAFINKVMISYNAGYYSYKTSLRGVLTTTELVNNKKFPLESRAYLLKMLGVNGFMDLWFQNKKK
jgi:hypothetical protein